MFIKELELKNFCGYKSSIIKFCTPEMEIIPWTILYGPNGIGKSNFLNAISLLSNANLLSSRFQSERVMNMFFDKHTFNYNYTPGVSGLKENDLLLEMRGVFSVAGQDLEVIIRNDNTKNSGVVKNELKDIDSFVDVLDADKPNNSYAFALDVKHKDAFIDFAKSVYGFDVYIPKESEVVVTSEYNEEEDDNLPETDERIYRCTDFVLIKPSGGHIHYCQMSAGEKKIGTMLQMLFNKHYGKSGVLLIDNIEMHIYFKRHLKLIEKMEEYFPSHQIIATTHSPVLIEKLPDSYLINVENYLLNMNKDKK